MAEFFQRQSNGWSDDKGFSRRAVMISTEIGNNSTDCGKIRTKRHFRTTTGVAAYMCFLTENVSACLCILLRFAGTTGCLRGRHDWVWVLGRLLQIALVLEKAVSVFSIVFW